MIMIEYLYKIQKRGGEQMNKSTVGMNIKKYRKLKKLKQKELAEMIGYTESSISKYEQGLIQIPNTVIDLISKALDVSPLEILGADEWELEFNVNGKLSEEVKTIEAVQSLFGKDAVQLLQYFMQLNDIGKQKALENVEDLTLIPRYIKKESPDDCNH